MIPSAKPYFHTEDIPAILVEIQEILKNGHLVRGKHVHAFEQAVCEYTGSRYAVSTNSGTSALIIALHALGIQGKEVIVPTNTFIATPNSVVFAGGKPVFVDINLEDYCLSLEQVKAKIGPNTAGVVLVHMAGLIYSRVKELRKLCDQNGIFLLEDSAHAFGATYEGKMPGHFGQIACYSCYPTKITTTGEGGIITTQDRELYEYCKKFNFYGHHLENTYPFEILGANYRMSEISAVLGRYQIQRVEQMIQSRCEIANTYSQRLEQVSYIHHRTVANKNSRHVYYKYITIVDESVDAVDLMKYMQENGVMADRDFYPSCHSQPIYYDKLVEKEFPNAEELQKRLLLLPIYVQMNRRDVDKVVQLLSEYPMQALSHS